MIVDVGAYAVVLAFAVVNGANDGGTIVAMGLRTSLTRPWLRVLVLVALFGLAPLLVGTEVATTLAERLVGFEGAAGRRAVLVAVVGSLIVVWVLASRGLPTSLTLALIGALAGAGVAAGLPVQWGLLGLVLIVASTAPLVGALGALALHRFAIPLMQSVRILRRAAPSAGHLLQGLAYGANDGQKMLAVLAVVAGTSATMAEVPAGLWAMVVAGFALGTVVGVGRIGPTIDGRVLPMRVEQAALAQLAGAGAVLGSAAVASPVSLVQATTGGLVGAGVSVTARRVRWTAVGHIVTAWLVTLPAAFAVAAAAAALLGVVRP